MYTFIEASDLADHLGNDIDAWSTPALARAQSVIETATVFVSALTSLEFEADKPVPERVVRATLSIAARHWLERADNLSSTGLGDWRESYVDPGSFVTDDDLTGFEKTLLGPWLSKSSGVGQISVVPAFGHDSTVYVPVRDTAEHFPLYEA